MNQPVFSGYFSDYLFFRKEVLAFAEYIGFDDVFNCFRDVPISNPSISVQQMFLLLLLFSSH